jgi:SAM-dependent methyltransferase
VRTVRTVRLAMSRNPMATTPGSHPEIQGGAFSGTFGTLLLCPSCRSPESIYFQETAAICSRCNASFSTLGGIIDFVAGQSDTALDVREYDQQKAVSFDASVNMFRSLKQLAGGAIPDNLGNVLEIGAGTGLLTLGMLAESEFDQAVITDISPNMLAVCSARLAEVVGAKRSRVAFATYSGQENIFGDEQYDLCIANSVLHHILDYAGLFRSARTLLKGTGTAIFVEPAAVFHEALTLAMAEAIVSLTGKGSFPDQLRILAAWVEQTRYRLRSAPAELAQFEDKHNFRREDLVREGTAAGFSSITIVPVNYDPLGIHAALNYQRELGIPREFAELIMPAYRRHAEYQFRDVTQADMSEMYLIALAF